MRIKTFKKDEYKGCPIYYRNFKNHFEYLTIVNNELYTASIDARPHWITNLFYILKIEKKQYSDYQLKNILKFLKHYAQTTIDFILLDKDNIKTET